MNNSDVGYKIINKGDVIIDSIPDPVWRKIKDIEPTKSNSVLEVDNKKIRVIVNRNDGVEIYLSSEKPLHIKKEELLDIELNFIKSRLKDIVEDIGKEKDRIRSAFLRLTHNIKTLSTLNIQDIDFFSPMGSTDDFNLRKLSDWELYVKELDNDSKTQLAKMLLRVYKNTQHIQNDLIVYNRLFNNINEEKDYSHHHIHKVIMRSVLSCASPLIESGVRLNIGESDKTVFIDYTSIQVALFYILDNIVKYIRPNTELKITFHHDKKTKENTVSFEMESLHVRKDEVDRIFDDGFSGRAAKLCKKNGSGIGLFVAKKLIEENNSKIEFVTDGKVKETVIGRPFGKNTIKITFNKVQ